MRKTTAFLFVLTVMTVTTASGQAVGSFIPTGSMTTPRSGHTATLLRDGRVLIVGGFGTGSMLSSAELYDPSTGTFRATGSMRTARRMHTATLLPDGRVLIAGGWGLSSADIYDPATETFTPTGDMLEDQGGHAATLLSNGKVLIAGGERLARPWPTAARAELYDPATGTFSFAESYAGRGILSYLNGSLISSGGPIWPTANLLPDGRVLLISENPPELYDPDTGAFSLTGAMVGYLYGVEWQAATSLKDGTVLVTGGNDDITCGGFDTAEVYDPSSGTFSAVGSMTISRDIHTSTLLPDGTVLLAGGGEGWCFRDTTDTAELYLPSSRSFVAAGRMTRSRTMHTATLLNDGTVLIAGGDSYWPHNTTNSAELYRPATAPHSGRTRLHR